MTARRQRGLALASVLWGVLILSLIAAAMLSDSLTSAQIDRNVWSATQAGGIADQAVSRAVLELSDDRADRQPRIDGTAMALRIDDVPVRLWIQDESGKVNLNLADKTLLEGLFVSAAMPPDAAAALADRIILRRTGPNGMPRATFRATDELLALPGVTRAFYDRVAPSLTVYGKSASLNRDTAPRSALRALPDLDDRAIDDLLRARAEKFARPPQPGLVAAALGAKDAAFLITADVQLRGAHVVRAAAVTFTGDPAKPYLVMAWR